MKQKSFGSSYDSTGQLLSGTHSVIASANESYSDDASGTDVNSVLLNSTTYDSYGHILSQSNPAVTDSLGFTGREFDSETGLYYFRVRYYNPDLGRFQSEDPTRFGPGDFNLRRYAFNNPPSYTDPFGFMSVAPPLALRHQLFNWPEFRRLLQERHLSWKKRMRLILRQAQDDGLLLLAPKFHLGARSL